MGDRRLRFAELFAGAGGLSMGLEWAGHECVWHAEIEPHARAVLRHRWPQVPLYGDVTQLDGRALVDAHGPIDLLTGGSPCQDLSVAGKRAGLAGARSGLFHEQVRLWRETQADLLLWENVMGALSSSQGKDFHVVLETLAGTTVPAPLRGGRIKWPKAGVIHGPDGRARVAYRSLDLQWFGPPQRRRRVFVCAVAPHALDRYDPAALLFTDAVGGCAGACGAGTLSPEPHRLRGHPAPGGTAREGATADAGTGAAFGWDKFNVTSATNRTRVLPGLVPTLHERGMQVAAEGAPLEPSRLSKTNSNIGVGSASDPMFTLQRHHHHGVAEDVAHTVDGAQGQAVVAFHATQDPISGTVVPAISANAAYGVTWSADLCGALSDGAHCGGGTNGQDAYTGRVLVHQTRPRRLTPLECERLMGWPDQHTAQGIKEDGTAYALPDSARYRLCGNGVGSPVTAWIGRHLA